MNLRDNPEFLWLRSERAALVNAMCARQPPRLTDTELARLDGVRFRLDEIECAVMGWTIEAHESARRRRGT